MGADGRGGVYRRIAITLIAAIAALLLARIPLPGVNTDVLEQLYRSGGTMSYDPIEHGIFCIQLHPFMSAAFLVELLALLLPRWRALRLGGYPERDRLWTRVVLIGLVLVILQAFFVVRWLRGTATSLYMFGDLIQGERNDPLWIAAQTLSLAAGTFLLFWLARLIDKVGTGNGFAVMIAAFLAPPLALELIGAVSSSREPILLPLGLAAVAVAAVTRLAGGRSLKPSAHPPGADRLPMPASSVKPVVHGASMIALPVSIAAFVPFVLPAALTPGTWMNRVVEAAIVGASCLLMTWLFNRPRLLAATWKRAGAPGPDATGMDDGVRAAFAQSLALALAICWLVMGIEWFCADSGLAISVVNMTMVACVVMDVAGEIQFRFRHGPLVPVWPVHRLFLLPVMLDALKAAGIPAFARGRRYRTLWNFFAPYVPVDILVPAEHLAPAEMILRARSGMDDQGTRQPMRDVATTTSS